MTSIKFTIIIPAYNNAEFLPDAIQNVLDQTYPDFELIIINDASPDNAKEVIHSFKDPRIIYIEHPENRGLSAARNTGIRNATGNWIAFLDGDDFFHPKKLEHHEQYIRDHPEVGVIYNARFELNHSSKTIRELWRPPQNVTLFDLTYGFPFSPSDMVVSRDWLLKVGLFDEKHTFVGEDLDINVRLALAGCNFGGIDRALNYRRFHSRRKYKDLRTYFEDTLDPLDNTFNDPRCPQEVYLKRNLAYAQHYMLWSIISYMQNDTEFGNKLCKKAIELKPSLISDHPSQFLETVVEWTIMDSNANHESLLKEIILQLPSDVAIKNEDYAWAVNWGYIKKAIRSIIWNGDKSNEENFLKGILQGTPFPRQLQGWVSAQLLNCTHEFGKERSSYVIVSLARFFERSRWKSEFHSLISTYYINQAFTDFHFRRYKEVPKEVFNGWVNNPHYLLNRGVISIFLKSIIKSPVLNIFIGPIYIR